MKYLKGRGFLGICNGDLRVCLKQHCHSCLLNYKKDTVYILLISVFLVVKDIFPYVTIPSFPSVSNWMCIPFY